MTKRYKSCLVVWNSGDNPVIETFYADSIKEINAAQGEWMNERGYDTAKMNLYEFKEGEYQSIRKAEFSKGPSFPEFAFIHCSPHEGKHMFELLRGAVIQIETGRILRFISKKEFEKENMDMDGSVTIGRGKDETCFMLGVVRLTDEDMDMMADPAQAGTFKEYLSQELFIPFAKWMTKFTRFTRNCEIENEEDS